MKKYFFIPVFLLTSFFTVMPTAKSSAFMWVVVKAAIKKAIKAADLAIQRLQNKTMEQDIKNVENTITFAEFGKALVPLIMEEAAQGKKNSRSLIRKPLKAGRSIISCS